MEADFSQLARRYAPYLQRAATDAHKLAGFHNLDKWKLFASDSN